MCTHRYQWLAGNEGTHFWHAHTGLQKIDGLYGSIVIRQPPSKDPNSNLYDYDLTTHVVLLSDWFHENAAERFPGRLAVNTGQAPESVLINGKGQFRVQIVKFILVMLCLVFPSLKNIYDTYKLSRNHICPYFVHFSFLSESVSNCLDILIKISSPRIGTLFTYKFSIILVNLISSVSISVSQLFARIIHNYIIFYTVFPSPHIF